VDLTELALLTSPAGRDALEAVRHARAEPAHLRVEQLRKTFGAALSAAALRQDTLRVRAAGRAPDPERMLFEEVALEQASAWPVAVERARAFADLGERRVTDLGAGIGFDTLALAQAGLHVRAVEQRPLRAALLRANAAALGLSERVAVLEQDMATVAPDGGLAFLDPDRRPGGVRTRDMDHFQPPVDAWGGLLAGYRASMCKLPPVLSGPIPLDGAQEVVSLRGRVRERRVRVGAWPASAPLRALALPSGNAIEGTGMRWPAPTAPREGDLLLDPDAAVTVAGLVGDLAAHAALRPMHRDIAYLVGPPRAPLPVPGTWLEIRSILRPRRRELNAWLAAEGIGNLELRTRGVAERATDLRKKLRPAGPAAGTLVFTRTADDAWVALGCRRLPA
jgi:hypothetical protein